MSTKIKTYHHGDLRQALLEEGLTLINEKGPDKLSLRELARRIGVSAMAPYRHYPDKNSLLAAISAYGFLQLTTQLETMDGSCHSGYTPLLQAGITYVQFALRQPALFRLMFGSGKPNGYHADLARARSSSFNVLMRHMQESAAHEQRVLHAQGCWALVHGLALLLLDGLLNIPDGEEVEPWLAQLITSTTGTSVSYKR